MSVQAVGLQRNTVDQYYTKPQLAMKYIGLFIEIVQPRPLDQVIEPSAGSGSFSNILKERLECNMLCFDIEPKQDYIIKGDFLKQEASRFTGTINHCIGNPPFGRQSSLAKKFIKKCCEFSSSIAFILPKSFKKPSFYKTFPLRFHKVYEEDCPTNSFMVNDKEYDVPCVFQIWVKKEDNREEEDIQQPEGFQYVSKTESPHFALRRVGFYAGKAFIEHEAKSHQSHYFVKLDQEFLQNTSMDLAMMVDNLNGIVYDFNNTVGARSISKPEFTKVINTQLRAFLQ